jgi:hypothetical protein
MDRKRNLDAAEIYDQVVAIDRQAKENYDAPLTNIVYMGMGEPLLNYKNVLESVNRITSADGLGMSPKRITVSTAGIAKMIRQLGDDEVKFNLALSLHAANDTKRNQIMPINESNTLAALGDALTYFTGKPARALRSNTSYFTTSTIPCRMRRNCGSLRSVYRQRLILLNTTPLPKPTSPTLMRKRSTDLRISWTVKA